MSDGALEMLNAIRGRHNLSAVGGSSSSVQKGPWASSSNSSGPWSPVPEQENRNYEEWYQRYKLECAKYHPLMRPDADGVSMLDWLDHEPLKRAFEDNLSPEPLAARFMKDFDPESLGFPKKQHSDFEPPAVLDDLELAVEYFHTVAKFALDKSDYHYRSVRVTQPEAAALRQEFCRRKQVGDWLGLFRIAKIEAHAISFTKHALRSGDGNKIQLIGSLYAFANSIEEYQRDMREIRDFLRRELRL